MRHDVYRREQGVHVLRSAGLLGQGAILDILPDCLHDFSLVMLAGQASRRAFPMSAPLCVCGRKQKAHRSDALCPCTKYRPISESTAEPHVHRYQRCIVDSVHALGCSCLCGAIRVWTEGVAEWVAAAPTEPAAPAVPTTPPVTDDELTRALDALIDSVERGQQMRYFLVARAEIEGLFRALREDYERYQRSTEKELTDRDEVIRALREERDLLRGMWVALCGDPVEFPLGQSHVRYAMDGWYKLRAENASLRDQLESYAYDA